MAGRQETGPNRSPFVYSHISRVVVIVGPRLTCDVLIQTWIKFPFMYGLPLSHHDQKLQLHNLDAEAADVPHPPFLSSITLSALVIVQASLLESVSCLLLYTYNCSIRECTTLNPLHTAIPGLRTSFTSKSCYVLFTFLCPVPPASHHTNSQEPLYRALYRIVLISHQRRSE